MCEPSIQVLSAPVFSAPKGHAVLIAATFDVIEAKHLNNRFTAAIALDVTARIRLEGPEFYLQVAPLHYFSV
jgi:hypothetical protein